MSVHLIDYSLGTEISIMLRFLVLSEIRLWRKLTVVPCLSSELTLAGTLLEFRFICYDDALLVLTVFFWLSIDIGSHQLLQIPSAIVSSESLDGESPSDSNSRRKSSARSARTKLHCNYKWWLSLKIIRVGWHCKIHISGTHEERIILFSAF